MAHPLFGPEVRVMLQENDTEGLKTFLETLHPATAAETLADDFGVEDDWRVLQHTGIRNQAMIFEYFPIDWQVQMVEGTGRQPMAKLIEQMSHDDRADLLRRLPPRVAEALLRLVDEADRRDIASLVKYEENTAGALMTTDYAWLPATISVSEALDRLRLQAPDRETIYYIYVLDDQHRLMGVVSLRDLILAPRHALIRDIMDREPITVKANDDREQVAQLVDRYDLLAVPVIDNDGRMVGIITYDDVIDVLKQEATEDVHRLGAVGPLVENYLKASPVRLWRNRAFWLALLFVCELFTLYAMAHFEDVMQKMVVLNFFIPLCISIGGNSGSQAVTLITRALALGQVSVTDWLRVLRHEFLMGLALGMSVAAIGFCCIVLFGPVAVDRVKLALVIAEAVACICLWGTLVGSMLPLFFKRVGIDPGIASSPSVATLVDVTGILIYFTIAKMHFNL